MRLLLIAAVSMLLVQGCKATKIYKLPMEEDPATSGTESPPPGDKTEPETERDAQPPSQTVWGFLKEKYDANNDGVVTKAEYDRGEEPFKRLDGNKDGQLTDEDFKRGRGRSGRMAQQILVRYFQADDNRRELKLEEVGQSFAKADTDKDGGMSLDEFKLLAEAVATGRSGGQTPPTGMLYRVLVDVVDTDQSGSVSLAELEAFFKVRDANKDGIWTMRGGGGGRRGARDPRATGAKKGTVAPDFTLKPPDGGAAVTLSSFRGKRPVALIFGSYT